MRIPMDTLGEGSERTENDGHNHGSKVLSRFVNLQIDDYFCDRCGKRFVSTLHPEIEGLQLSVDLHV
jgi:hypothetical protein